MSIMRCVGFVAYTSTAPPVPTGTIAALATINPVRSFIVEKPGAAQHLMSGATLRYPRPDGVVGTTVTLKEYACAMGGIEHADWIGNVRTGKPGVRAGPPS